MTVHIFIETGVPSAKKNNGQATNEWHFIFQYISHLFPDLTGLTDIKDVGGKDNLHNYTTLMQDYSLRGDKNIVIFDCDSSSNGGGLKSRVHELEEFKTQNKVDFDYFLFPNNNDDGAFEDLLLHLINPKHQGIMDCFHQYEMCVGGQDAAMGGGVYETPNTKAKIYTYITTFRRSRTKAEKVKNGDWDFENKEYWDLDSSYLDPLKDFLLNTFRKEKN